MPTALPQVLLAIEQRLVSRSTLVSIAMERKLVNIRHFSFFIFFLLITRARLLGFNEKDNIVNNNHRACMYVQCENDDTCVQRKFRCKDPPCPSMLYCAKSRTESIRGPSTCDTVRCSIGYVCMLKVRRCRWDERCKQQIARCVSRKEYHEGPASCAGFECPQGSQCILRESFCVSPPCKLLRSCAKNKEVNVWFSKCRSLACPSEYECFLRRPEKNCSNPPCKHAPDCVTTTEDEVTNEHCRGWICPRMQKCSAEVSEPCNAADCNVRRTCNEELRNYSSPLSRRSTMDNVDQLTIPPQVDVKIAGNTSQENIDEKTRMPHSWLNHLNSKTELDAIELWIQNAQGQRDFKRFQDWLRTVKDVLGSGAYAAWIKETLASTSRGEEFRKWLRASHVHGSLNVDKLDSEKPIFPGRERPRNEVPHSLTENRLPIHDTLTTLSPDDLARRMDEINSLLREQNLTSVTERLLVPNKIMLPAYSAFEAALLNSLRESNLFPYFNPVRKDPVYKEEVVVPHQLPKIANTHGQSYYVFPVENVEGPGSTQAIDRDFDPRHTSPNGEIIPEDRKEPNEQENNFFFNYDSSPVIHVPDHEDVANRNFKGIPDKISFYGHDTGTFTDNSEPIFNRLFSDKLGDSRTFSDSSEPSIDLPLIQSTDEDEDELALDIFLEQNKETLLPYLQTLMEALDLEESTSNSSELSSDGSSVKNTFVDNKELRDYQKTFEKTVISSTIKPKNISCDQKSSNEGTVHASLRTSDSDLPRDNNLEMPRYLDKRIPSTMDPQQEKDPRTREPIYGDEDSKFRFFYDVPSYGAGENVAGEDYDYEVDSRSHVAEGRDVESATNHGKHH
ncbi:uncharacterized protein LOC128873151 [Hylaeus volcanicus]|uniref:uncharacterized protein LOC128873151 n=1 Tax=Hylaeus volcanicus TaxID=313075 RepID=UPI0023B8498E|nr:uncharacterized protein LOC128873151 [Hylaeus volcanicus]